MTGGRKLLELTKGNTAPYRFKLEKLNDAGEWAVPDFAGATVQVVTRTAAGLVVVNVGGSFESVGLGVVAFELGAIALERVDNRTRASTRFDVTYANGKTETFPKGAGRLATIIVDA